MEADHEVIDLTVKHSEKSRAQSEEEIQQLELPIDGVVFEKVNTPVNDVINNTLQPLPPVSPVVSPQKEKEEIVLETKDVESNFLPLPDFDSEMQQISYLREVLQSVYSGILREGIRKGTEYPYIPDNFNRENTDALKHKLMTGILRLYEDSRGIPERERASSTDKAALNGKLSDTRSTDWVEDKEEVPPPPFGLESAVIDHLLKTWTSDENKVAYLKSWVRSLGAPANEHHPLGIQITNISRVVKDGFIQLLVPIIRRMSTINPICVYIRQNHTPPTSAKSPQSAAYQKHFKLDEDDILRSAEELGIDFSESESDESSGSDGDERGSPRVVQRQGRTISSSGGDKGDPFVAMESVVFDIRIKRVVDAETLERLTASSDVVHQYGTGASVRVRTTSGYIYSSDMHFPAIHQARSLSSYRTDSNDYSSLSEINSALQDLEKAVALEQASIPIPYSDPEPYNENKPVNLTEIISSIPVINQWFPQPQNTQRRSGSMADVPYQRSVSLAEPLMHNQHQFQRSASMTEPSVRYNPTFAAKTSSSSSSSSSSSGGGNTNSGGVGPGTASVGKATVAAATAAAAAVEEKRSMSSGSRSVSADNLSPASTHSIAQGSGSTTSNGSAGSHSRSPSVDEPAKPRKADSKIAARLEALRKK